MFNIHFVNKGQTLCAYLVKLPIKDPKPLLPNINSYTKFEEIGHKLFDIVHGNKFSTQINGNDTVYSQQNLPVYNPKPLFPKLSTIKQIFEENWSENAQDRERARKYTRPLVFTSASGYRAGQMKILIFLVQIIVLHICQ